MSGQIFISYRREESRWSARSLYDRLAAHFDRKQIFMDIDAIAPGDDFFEAIEKTVGECDVLIAVIGAHWLTSKDEYDGRRLDNPDDLVRMEIATALRRAIRVIPVLVDGALMPRSTDLPEDLKAIVRRNALRISDTGFDDDCRRLVTAIEQVLEKNAAEQREREEKEQRDRQRLEAERLEKERLEIEQRETEKRELLEAERRQKEEQDQLQSEQRQREETERIAQRREREQRERLEHQAQAQLPSQVAPVAPSASPAKPEADKPSAETPKMVYPLMPKPVEPEREKPPPPSSGETGGKSPSKQVIVFLALATVLVVGGLIYLAIRASQSPPPQSAPIAAVTPVPSVIATPNVEVKVTPTLEVVAQPTAPVAVVIPSPSASAETTVKILHLQRLPKILAIWQDAAQEYEKAHPGVKIEFDYLQNEAFKAKLPTLLQSKDRPSLFHSWGGGVMYEQIKAGVCQDITSAISEGGFKDTFYPAGLPNFTYQGRTYGLPNDVGPIVFWYNKELCEKAGVDPTTIKYWDDLIDAVKKCQAAGITPLATGGKDKWPLHFYPALLMMRILGKEGMQAAYEGKNGGFASPDVIKAFQLYKDLATLNPFQKGYLANTYSEAAGTFHDGKTAFHLMGTWDLMEGRFDAADQKGLPDEKLGWFFFPEVKDGKGHANDIFASLDGWLVGKDAPKQTVDFMKVWLGKEIQDKLAEAGLFIPMVKGTSEVIKDQFLKQIAQEVANSQWIAIAIDQLLGSDTGRVFNDASVDIAAGNMTAKQAAKVIEKSWEQNKE